MNKYIFFKYYLLILLPLIINGFSSYIGLSTININKRLVISNNPIKMSSNYNLDNININNLMNNFIKKNNFINTTLSSHTLSSDKIKTNTLFFNTYYVDDLLIEKNLTRIILNLRKGNNSLYYINKTNNIETICNSCELSSKIIKNIIFTDLNKIMNNSLGIIYEDI
jgi:hypothetical protein